MNAQAPGRTGIEITEFVFGARVIGGIDPAVPIRGLGRSTEQGVDRLSEGSRRGHPGRGHRGLLR